MCLPIYKNRKRMASEYYTFGPHKIHRKLIFYTTNLSYAMVNLRPVVPGIFVRGLNIILVSVTVLVYFDLYIFLKCLFQSLQLIRFGSRMFEKLQFQSFHFHFHFIYFNHDFSITLHLLNFFKCNHKICIKRIFIVYKIL